MPDLDLVHMAELVRAAMKRLSRDRALCEALEQCLYLAEDRQLLLQSLADRIMQVERLAGAAVALRMVLCCFARDIDLECRCGEPPYEDGEECPRCLAIDAMDKTGWIEDMLRKDRS